MPITRQTLGTRLQVAREAAGLLIELSAQTIEISPERLAGLECGEQSVNSLEIHRLAKLYKVTRRSLLVIEEEVPDGVA